MEMEVKSLMDNNEMLSHIFLGCIPIEQLEQIRDTFVGETDWQKQSVKIPVELTIGGVSVNPKKFFDTWRNQMEEMVLKEATDLVAEKLGSKKMRDMQDRLYEYEQVLKSWEDDINWDVKNPLI